jgi:glycosyltransferase involved in cell wall biosynthesis
MIVHQFLPTLEPGAVGAHSLMARDLLRSAGHTSEIYTDLVHDASAGEGARPLRDYRGDADVLVYQMAIGSTAANAALAQRAPIVVNHHNFTPLRLLAGWDPVAAYGVGWGRSQLRELATRSRLGIAVSRYNEADLIEVGFDRTTVVPILLDVNALTSSAPDPAVRSIDATTWLFVGRIAPNKAQHDLVKAFAAYRRFFDPQAQLVLVGGGVDSPYGHTVTRFVHALELDDAVTLTGPLAPATLAAHYADADVFVVVSDHEGFCVPLLESMAHRVPIVAYAATAVPETVGDAGLLLDEKYACTIATAVHRVVTNDALRSQLVAAGARRVRDFDISKTGPAFVAAVTAPAS